MMKSNKLFSRVIAVAMIICTILMISIPASAATCSSGIKTRTITVTTKANYFIPGSESVTLKQNKGSCTSQSYNFFTRRTTYKTSAQYGEWDITVRATDGSHTFSKTLTGSSIKLNLKPNKTYKITVSWDSQAALFKELSKGCYTSYPTWYVKSTYKVSNIY